MNFGHTDKKVFTVIYLPKNIPGAYILGKYCSKETALERLKKVKDNPKKEIHIAYPSLNLPKNISDDDFIIDEDFELILK